MSNEWLTYIKEVTPEEGKIMTKDLRGKSISIDWKRTDILSEDLAHFKRSICELASEELGSIEWQFLRAYPESASQEIFLRSCVPLLKNGPENADWGAIKEEIQTTIKQFYLADLSKFGEIIKPLMNDLYFFAAVKNEGEDHICGYIMFSITPALPFGNVKVINLLVREKERGRGLEKAMLSSIFKLIPQTKRLFCFARPTHKTGLEMYKALDFVPDSSSFVDPNHKVNTQYCIPLEYRIER